MPILIWMKEPPIKLIIEGEIKDDSEKRWDEIFNNQMLMAKNKDGRNVIVPLLRECNIAFLQEVTQEEVDEQRKKAEEQRQGPAITRPQFVFPSGRKGKG